MLERIPFGARLTTIYVSALAVAILAFTMITYAFVSATVDRMLDTRLTTALGAVRTIVHVDQGRIGFDADDERQFATLIGSRLGGLVLDAKGVIIAGNRSTVPGPILIALAATDLSRTTTARVHLLGQYLDLAIAPVFDGTKPVGRIAIWQSRTSYYEVMRITLLALIGIGSVTIALATIVGIVIAKRAMRPLTELAAMISEIEAHDLSERLTWKGPKDELGQLCATFDRLLDRLQNAFERRRRFAADASHELRTPISVIRAEAELALRKPRDPQEYRAAIETICTEIERLETLTDALLATARADRTELRVIPLDAAKLVEKVAARMTPPAREHGLELAVETPAILTVAADAISLEGALAALLDNALRYAKHMIAIRAEQSGAGVTIAVLDDGPGFSEDALRFGTDRFWHETLPGHRGTGLGLAIVRAAAESFDGFLSLGASPHGGAQVTIHLPAVPAQPNSR